MVKDSYFLLWENTDVNKVMEFFINNVNEKFNKTEVREATFVNQYKIGILLDKLHKYNVLHIDNNDGVKLYYLNYRQNNKLLNSFMKFRDAFNDYYKRSYKKKKV